MCIKATSKDVSTHDIKNADSCDVNASSFCNENSSCRGNAPDKQFNYTMCGYTAPTIHCNLFIHLVALHFWGFRYSITL
jgi:hypothetical protein